MTEYLPPTLDWVREQVELYEGSGGKEGTTLRDTGLPCIIMGDFNVEPEAWGSTSKFIGSGPTLGLSVSAGRTSWPVSTFFFTNLAIAAAT